MKCEFSGRGTEPKRATIREKLATMFGNADRIVDPHRCLDAPCLDASFVLDDHGSPFVHCGGEVLAKFDTGSIYGRPVYLVLDMDATRRWEAANAKNDFNASATIAAIGHMPRPTLKLVQSA